MLKKMALWLMILMLLAAGALAEAPLLVDRINTPDEHADFAFAEGAPLLEILFPQILNSDAAVLRCGDQVVLIDCASKKYAQRVVNLLNQMGVTEIDSVINTHPHYDHIQGLEIIAQNVKVKELRICFPATISQHAQTALDVCDQYDIPVKYYQDGAQWDIGGTVIDVWIKGEEGWDLNNSNAVMRLQFGERTALFAADAEFKLQKKLVEVIPAELLDTDLLKYPHHGNEAMEPSFMAAVSPAFAVLTNNGGTAYKASKYCLRLAEIPFACTVPGYVCARTDGTTWLVERLPMDVPVNNPSRPDTRFQ